MTTWRVVGLLALLGNSIAGAQAQIPKDLEGWQAWVQHGEEFRHCPFLAGTDGATENTRICAWPGKLKLDVNQSGGKFSQTWLSYAPIWIQLPGDLDYWPGSVTVNGTVAAVVAREGIPQILVPEGASTVAGNFMWLKRPESLAVPSSAGLIDLTVDGRTIDKVDRPNDAVWLGKRHDADVAQRVDVQVYRLLTDGIPATLETRLSFQAAGDVREEILPNPLPNGFAPMSLESELPASLDSEGRLHVQVRAGSWAITLSARATDDVSSITTPNVSGTAPPQEVWSYASNDRLRIAALQGAEPIDPGQANVPADWRRYPSYRVTPGESLHVVERSRGVSPQESNRLVLQRELYLDFAHSGFTAIDRISGQMRNGWRLDMRAPYRLMRAGSSANNLLVTQTEGALTGVELRASTVSLATVARIDVHGGALPASGWTERMDRVSGVLNLPPGHRLLAAFGTDSAPDAWVERWGLLDLFLLLITTIGVLRLFGWRYALVAFAAVVLLNQEEPFLVWWLLGVLLASALARAIPEGWPRTIVGGSTRVLLALLLFVSVPLAINQVRFALYPQLADAGGYLDGERSVAQYYGLQAKRAEASPLNSLRMAATADGLGAIAAAPAMEEVVVTGSRANSSRPVRPSVDLPQRYAPGTSIQAGPGMPHWRYAAYGFGWSGPVDPAQTVRFVILPPWLVGLWRLLGVAMLAILFVRMARGGGHIGSSWRSLLVARRALAPCVGVALACAFLCSPSRADSTPDNGLLNELKSRLSQPAKCVPTCAEIMAARLTVTPTALEASLDVAALSSVAVALPSAGEGFDPDSIAVDGASVPGVYRDSERHIWVALKPGAHTIKISARLPTSDSIQLQFPQMPRGIIVNSSGWDVSGVNAGKLLGNTIELLRRRAAAHDPGASHGTAPFPPFVRIRREFSFDLDWSVQTTVERLAPAKGGFTLEIPLLPGESVLTSGLETNGGTRVSAGFDSDASSVEWRSNIAQTGALALTASTGKPWNEVWVFKVSPTWRIDFSGVPAVMPDNIRAGDWTFEYFPRPGETLNLKIARPAPAPGGTLAIDKVQVEVEVGKRVSNAKLLLNYRSTQGGSHNVRLPETMHLTAVTVDGQTVPVRPEQGVLPLEILPGTHAVQIDWQSSANNVPVARAPAIDLGVPSSNIDTTVKMPHDRWVLYAGGQGVGPAILYWGEVLVFVILAIALGRSRHSPLQTYEWLLLGLGLSTFSWSALLLFAGCVFALRWREGFAVVSLSTRQFNCMQLGLIILSGIAVLSLVAAIPSGLLGNPDMRIAGNGQSHNELMWFNDQTLGALPEPWVLSVSLWWYKAAMLTWALWLAFALARWLPMGWRALGAGGFWRRAPAATVAPPRAEP